MMISGLLQRLTTQLSTQRGYSLLKLAKASRQSKCPSRVYPIERVGGVLRYKSDLTSGDQGDDGKSFKSLSDDSSEPSQESESSSDSLVPSLTRKYKLFEASEEELILDYREEMINQSDPNATDWPSEGVHFPYRERQSKYEDINLERGKNEVIDIDELVTLLRQENMEEIVVLGLPPELQYSDYMVIASAKSFKHLEVVSTFLVKVWKLKKHRKDPFLFVEGEDTPDWKSIDMNSIIVHLFMPETRAKYDLESLWSLGAQYDDLTQRPVIDPGLDSLEKHLNYLKSLVPAEMPIRKADMIPISVKPGTSKKEIMKMQREILKSKMKKEEIVEPTTR